MRKIFTTLKSVVAFALVVAMTLSVSCSYDDTAIKNDISKVKTDLAKLEERVAALENKLTDELVAAIDLVKNAVVVTGVVTDENGNTTVTLSDGKSFVIEKTSDNDTILAAYAEDGVYYWAFFEGETFVKFLEVEGQKVPVFAEGDCAPAELVFSVDEATGNLLVSIDGGANWVDSGISTNKVAGACVFTDVVVNEDGSVTFYFADGTSFEVAKAELVEFEATRTGLYVKAGETKSVPFAINDAVEDINVMNQPLGWKASIESTRAVGGMDYVLNVTAPSKDFAYAEKGGKVSIHFNTAAGACKVMNVEVNLAEMSLSVDKAGNITLTNTLLDYYQGTDPLTWEPYEYEDFVTWYLGLMPVQYFNGSITENDIYSAVGSYNWMWGVNEYPYVDGEYECQVVETSVQWIFENIAYSEMGTDSYVIFAIPFADGGQTPVFEEAVTAVFKQLNIAVEEVEPYFNDILLNVTFAGAEKYHMTLVGESDLEWYDGIEGYIQENIMMYFAYNYIQFANTIEEDFYGKEITVKDLIHYGTEPWMTILPNETYYLIVLPIEDSSVAYTDYTLEDFLYYEFKTEDVVAAAEPIAYTATFNEEDSSMFGITVNVSYDPEVVDYAYYKWYGEEQFDLSKDELLLANKVSLDYGCYVNCDDPAQEKFLAVLLVNKNGEYYIDQKSFKSKDVVYSETQIAIESVTFDGKYAQITLSEGEYDTIRWYANKVTNALPDEATLARLAYTGISGSKTAYTNPFSGNYDANWSNFQAGNTYFFAVAVTFEDGTVSNVVTAEYEYPAEVAETIELTSAVAVHADASYIGGTGYDVTFSNGDVTIVFQVQTLDKTFLREGDWNGDFSWAAEGYINSVSWTGVGLPWPYAMTVAVVDGAYDILLECLDYNNNYKPYTAHFAGQIEGFTLPVEEEDPLAGIEFTIPGEGQSFDLDYKYTVLVDGLDENNSLRVAQDNGWTWDIKFNSGLAEIVAGDYKAGSSSFSSADALEVDTYNGGFQNAAYNYIYPDEYDKVTTFNVQKQGDIYCITMIGSGGYGNDGKSYRCVYIGKLVK